MTRWILVCCQRVTSTPLSRLLYEFRAEGCHLEATLYEQLQGLRQEESNLCAAFEQAINEDMAELCFTADELKVSAEMVTQLPVAILIV